MTDVKIDLYNNNWNHSTVSKVKLATIVEGWPEGSLFDSYYTKV